MQKILILTLLVISSVGLAGCGYTPEQRGVSGAALGGATGAAIGASTGGGPGDWRDHWRKHGASTSAASAWLLPAASACTLRAGWL